MTDAASRAGRPLPEIALCAVALGVLAALVYGPHVVHGGFYWDDWRNAATTRFSPDGFVVASSVGSRGLVASRSADWVPSRSFVICVNRSGGRARAGARARTT